MSAWHDGLGPRLAIASCAAVLAILALQRGVDAYERDAIAARIPHEKPPPSALASLGERVVPAPGVVALASRIEAIAPDTAPVYQVLADGTLSLRRAPAAAGAPSAPGAANAAAEAPRTAIVVPQTPFARWSPAARGAFVELLAALLPARPLPRERVVLVDAPLSERDLQTVLAWLP